MSQFPPDEDDPHTEPDNRTAAALDDRTVLDDHTGDPAPDGSDAPGLWEWRRSLRGNLTRRSSNMLLTVFRRYGRYCWSIRQRGDAAAGERVWYSPRKYRTEDEARDAADQAVRASTYQSAPVAPSRTRSSRPGSTPKPRVRLHPSAGTR